MRDAVGDDAGFLEQLAGGGVQQRFVDAVERAGDGLPEAGPVGALDQQDFEVGGVDDDEDGFGDLVGHEAIVTSAQNVVPASQKTSSLRLKNVVPAQAGIQVLHALSKRRQTWIPACAGTTV